VPTDPRDKLGLGTKELFANTQAYAGYLALLYGDPEAALKYLKLSLLLDPNNGQAKALLEVDTFRGPDSE
jgi:hypothetical protein